MTVRLEIVAKPGARMPGIVRRDDGIVVVAVRERAIDGKANDALVRAVAAWLALPPSRVSVSRGASARRKVLAVDGIDAERLARSIETLPMEG